MKKLATRISALAIAAVAAISFSSNAQILYKVEKPGSDKVSYILGTHHFAPLSAVDSMKSLKPALESVTKLYGEIDMNSMTDPAQMMAMQNMMIAAPDSTLDKVLTPVQLDSVANVVKEYLGDQVPMQMLCMMKPAAVNTTLAQGLVAKALPLLDPTQGIDMTMQTRARELGKEVAGLETMDYQLNILFGRPIAKQAESLMGTVRDIKQEEKMAVDLSNAYIAHDIEKILKMMQEEDDPDTFEDLIYVRNENWVRVLKDELPGKSVMVVVGAGHLPGDRGVLEGLRKEGFTVTPME